MNRGNGEQTGKTEVKRQESQCDDAAPGGRLGASANQSSSVGNIENSTDQPNSQRKSFQHLRSDRRTIPGGILRQLKVKNRRQLAYYRSQIEELEEEYLQLEELVEKLRFETGEDLENDTDEAPGSGGEE